MSTKTNTKTTKRNRKPKTEAVDKPKTFAIDAEVKTLTELADKWTDVMPYRNAVCHRDKDGNATDVMDWFELSGRLNLMCDALYGIRGVHRAKDAKLDDSKLEKAKTFAKAYAKDVRSLGHAQVVIAGQIAEVTRYGKARKVRDRMGLLVSERRSIQTERKVTREETLLDLKAKQRWTEEAIKQLEGK